MRSFLVAASVMAGVVVSGAAADRSRVFVVLEGEPLATLQASGRRAAPAAIANRRAALAGEQGILRQAVANRGGEVLQGYQVLNNALFIEISAAELPGLRALPGVKAIQPERHFQRCTSTSVPFVGAGRAWGLPAGGFTGQGMKIGIIDSGIDYTHADFGGTGTAAAFLNIKPTLIEGGSFPTAKVVGGTDFVGDNYDSTGAKGTAVPKPDPNPLDPSANGHGTHVAGIAAGRGVTLAGKTYTGPYSNGLPAASFLIGPGVAPEASLYALKVFGSGGSTSSSIVAQALEWAADPNGDGDTSDRLDVVNLSLGSAFGNDNEADLEADSINRLSLLGVVVAISAGNAGNTAYIVSSPGTAARGITVANAYDDGFTLTAIQINAPASVAGEMGMEEGGFTPSLATTGPVTAQVVATDPVDACGTIRNTAQLNGKIALIDRGTCFFVDKIRAAQGAGAIGVLMVNNVDGPPISMGGSGDTSDIHIPGVMVSKLDGARLRAQLNAGLSITLKNGVALPQPQLANNINESSARGPVLGSGSLKPDISAPGSSIESARSGGGSTAVVLTGTSMSAPHVTGAAALVRQAHPTWSTEDIKAALMDTANSTMADTSGAAYPESRMGAGQLNVFGAVQTEVVARVAGGSGRVSLSFPPQVLSKPASLSAQIEIANHGKISATYAIRSTNTLDQPGARLVPVVTQITIGPGETRTVNVRLELDPSRLVPDADRSSPSTVRGGTPRYGVPEVSGQLWFTGGPTGSESLHVPWHGMVRAASDLALGASESGVPAGATPEVSVPVQGTPVVAQPLLGLFQFGSQVNGTQGRFLAVGAATDAGVVGVTTNARVFFALAWNPGWITPQREEQSLDVEIDLNDDGVVDQTLSNGNAGSLAGTGLDDYASANDGYVTAVVPAAGGDPVTGEIWNVLPPSFRDTAPTPNGRAVLAARTGLLGMSTSKTSFRYRGVINDHSFPQLTTSWQRFDFARPLVDGTPFGLQNSPWCDAAVARVRVNRAAAGALTEAKVMILPQNNAGAGYFTMLLHLDTEDFNGNGIPDAWELSHLGDLKATAVPPSDRDGDGFSDVSEYLAGTDPRDPQSRLILLPAAAPDASVRWQSVSGRIYSLWRADALGESFRPVMRNIAATPPINSAVDPEPIVGNAAFYRIRVE